MRKKRIKIEQIGENGSNGVICQLSRGRSESDDYQAEEVFNNSSITHLSFNQISEAIIEPEQPCWGCFFKFGNEISDNKAVNHLCQVYTSNKHVMSELELAKLISKTHEEIIHGPEISRGNTNAILWPVSSVLQHIQFHIFEHRACLESSAKQLIIMENTVINLMVAKTADGVTAVDHKMVASYIHIVSQKAKIISTLNKLKN